MKVKDLIEKLEQLDGESIVCIQDYLGQGVFHLIEIESVENLPDEDFELYDEIYLEDDRELEEGDKIVIIS